MDLDIVRSLVTLAAFGTFLGIVWWAYAPARKARLDAIAKSILEENT
jgi:cbb3-type cytochrome oxidase subunit 3